MGVQVVKVRVVCACGLAGGGDSGVDQGKGGERNYRTN